MEVRRTMIEERIYLTAEGPDLEYEQPEDRGLEETERPLRKVRPEGFTRRQSLRLNSGDEGRSRKEEAR